MKIIAFYGLVAALLAGGFVPTASAQQLRIGTVDVKRIFESYYKTKEAEQKVNEQRNRLKAEMDDRLEGYKKAVAEVQKLDDEVKRPEISTSVREASRRELQEKLGLLNNRQRADNDYRANGEKELQDLSMRLRDAIVKDIMAIVTERVKSEQYDLVFDRTGLSLNNVPVLLYAKESYDFTPEVVTALNKSRGTAEAVKTTEVVRPPTPKKPK
ncbi:MAG TPA: OmpH family outer membrane protein [Chthoniobacteraceae bacterium]|jgi:Skp family chaperone for outer membrane proteins|nr:OmpH family outer membrane protein [Chthoniobacteraceae bacterium]